MQAPSGVLPRHGRLWLIFGLAVSGAFFILGFFGREVYRQAPPIPNEVRTTDGRLLMTRDGILTGQTVWQSTGGQQLGSIWGHGAYQAPDWTADWLHREATTLLDEWALGEYGAAYGQLADEQRAPAVGTAGRGGARAQCLQPCGIDGCRWYHRDLDEYRCRLAYLDIGRHRVELRNHRPWRAVLVHGSHGGNVLVPLRDSPRDGGDRCRSVSLAATVSCTSSRTSSTFGHANCVAARSECDFRRSRSRSLS